MTDEQNQRRSALSYGEALIGDLHPDDLREIEIKVEPGGSGDVMVTIRADVMAGQSAANVLETTYAFMRRRQAVRGV